jgi:hypothetical protein
MRTAIALAMLFVASCNKPPASHEPNGPIRSDDTIANAASQVESGQAGDLPPPGTAARFVGKWAKDQKSCKSAAWQFTDSTLRTPDGGSCSFSHVTEVPGGYDIQATCTAKDAAASESLTIRFAESAKAMLFTSKTMGSPGLVFCGRDA